MAVNPVLDDALDWILCRIRLALEYRPDLIGFLSDAAQAMTDTAMVDDTDSKNGSVGIQIQGLSGPWIIKRSLD